MTEGEEDEPVEGLIKLDEVELHRVSEGAAYGPEKDEKNEDAS